MLKNKIFKNIKNWFLYFQKNMPLLFLIIIFFSFIFIYNFSAIIPQHFSYLADSFLHGKFYFLENVALKIGTDSDMVFYNNHYYWPLGPLPAVILMPFVFIFKFLNLFFYQGYLQFFLVLLILLILFKINRKIDFSKSDSLYLASAFLFSSMFLGVALISSSWFFAQVITVFFIFLALWEYFNKKRYFLIGIIFGLIFLTRITAGLGLLFFILEILLNKKKREYKIKDIFLLLLPFVFIVGFLFFYNYLRFNNFLEQGYGLQILYGIGSANRDYGLFSLKHLAGNIYYSIFSMPLPVFINNLSQVLKFPFIQANPWGMSIFLTSPYLIYLFFLKFKDKISYFLLITVIFITIPIFLNYGIGFSQFGYRYALDFFPFLFLLFIINYRNKYKFLSKNLKLLIILSSLFNLYLFFTFF
ncbi:MAG: hypothetical protein ABH808_00210 [Candidatus Kuenenbacteria bacterium]